MSGFSRTRTVRHLRGPPLAVRLKADASPPEGGRYVQGKTFEACLVAPHGGPGSASYASIRRFGAVMTLYAAYIDVGGQVSSLNPQE